MILRTPAPALCQTIPRAIFRPLWFTRSLSNIMRVNRSSKSFASAFAVLALVGSGVSFGAEQFATPEQARALLDRAIAALKVNEAAALKQFNNEK
jgi:hypothetical protein